MKDIWSCISRVSEADEGNDEDLEERTVMRSSVSLSSD